MEIVDKAKAALAAKKDAVAETVGGLIDRGKEAAHHLVDKVTHAVKGTPAAVEAPEPRAVRVSKRPGQKKPRAERRRARRLSRANA